MIKVFGIGNILLGDDAIGVKVMEQILPHLHSLSPHIKGIIGETDCFFCLDHINLNDFVIIIDSTYLDLIPGTLSYTPFSDCKKFITPMCFAHEITLLKMLLSEYPDIEGYLIGIEMDRIGYSLELSPALESRFDAICEDILQFLKKVVKHHA